MEQTFTPWRLIALVVLPVFSAVAMLAMCKVTYPEVIGSDWTSDGAIILHWGSEVDR